MNKQPCVFCELTNTWPRELIIGELEYSNVVLSQDQFFLGWCLVIAKSHVIDLFELSSAARSNLDGDVKKVSGALREILKPDLFNYAAFGNVVPHLHWNVIPRYMDDTLWGGPPWPHSPLPQDPIDSTILAAKIREKIKAKI